MTEVEDEKQDGNMRRIDIYLKDKNTNVISIENKIYASDQADQLKDYKEFSGKKSLLLYLTLLGSKPSEYSTGKNLKENELSGYFYISYQNTILPWINSCIDKSRFKII